MARTESLRPSSSWRISAWVRGIVPEPHSASSLKWAARSFADLLTQTEGYLAYTVMLKERLSYGIYTQTVDEAARKTRWNSLRVIYRAPSPEGEGREAGQRPFSHLTRRTP